MQDLEKLGKALFGGAKGGALRQAASSANAQALEKKLDPRAVERAAASGDPEQIKALLTTVLSTPEGRSLYEQLSKLGL